MSAFITYLLLGISLSAPVGPINAAQLDRGARYGFMHAWLIGLGAMCADLLYMLLIYFGLTHFLSTPFMRTFLWLFGCFVLIYTGIATLKELKQIPLMTQDQPAPSGKHAFQYGFMMAIFNPLNILFWLGIYGSLLAESVQVHSVTQVLLHSSGIFAGILLWDVIMALLASSFRKFGNQLFLQGISAVAGMTLIGFGLYFGYQAYLALSV